MVSQFLHICEITFVLIAACSGLVAAWFELRDRWQTDVERKKTKALYGKKWEAIRDSGLFQLPEKAIISALDVKTRLTKAALRQMNRLFRGSGPVGTWGVILAITLPVVGGAAGGWIKYGWFGAIALASPPSALWALWLTEDISGLRFPKWMHTSATVLWGASFLVLAGIWLNLLLGLGVVYAAGFMLPLLPAYMFILAIPCALVAKFGDETTDWELFDRNSWAVFGMATAISFSVTLCSLLIGNLVTPDAWIPKTLQMLLCNVAFDGFTMVATFAILARAVGQKRKYPIPVAILIDVVVASLFACASLWLGLMGTEHALSIKQVLGVLIARSAEDAAVYAFGPYFWAMHTTFLPTLGYIALILLFWIAKLVVLPVAKTLKKGREIDKPHNLMAGLFLFVVAIAMALAGVLHVVNDVPNRASVPPAQVVEDGA